MTFDLTRRLVAETLGTFFLVMAIVGSGIMAQELAGGNEALALLCNMASVGAVLFVIITIFVSVSGAHFNPAVSLVMWLRGGSRSPGSHCLYRRADRWRLRRRHRRASDVWSGAGAVLPNGADRYGSMVRRVRRHVQTDRHHSRLRAF